ncbi:MAG TPA: VOC family protein [Dehalococcoidia bacterium]|nr:VOC family protein [Dehalococcoidia bacterium]
MLKVEVVRSVNWNAADAKEAERFYTDVLGASVRDRMNIAGADVAHLMLGTTMVGLFDASGGPRPGVPHHTLQMAWPGEAGAVAAELEGKGVKVQGTREHRGGPGFSVYVEDPIGNRLELSWDPPS